MAEINQGILDDIVNSISDTKKSGESFRQEAKANHTNLSLVVKDLNSLVLKNKSSIEESVNQIDGKVREIEEDIAGQIQNIYSEIQKNTAIQQNIINTIYQLDKKIESLMTKGVGGELVKPGSLTERLKTAFGSGAVTPLSPVTTGVAPQTAGQALGAAGAISAAAIKSGSEYFGITQPEQVRTPAGEQPLPTDAHAGHAHGDSTTPAGKQTAGTAAPAFEQGYLESGMSGKVISIPGDPRDGGKREHQGIDVAHQIGSNIKARGDGVIVKSEVQGGRINAGYGGTSGGIITVRYADGLTVKYLHTSDHSTKQVVSTVFSSF